MMGLPGKTEAVITFDKGVGIQDFKTEPLIRLQEKCANWPCCGADDGGRGPSHQKDEAVCLQCAVLHYKTDSAFIQVQAFLQLDNSLFEYSYSG